MYKDYEVVYESNINEFLIFWIIAGVIALALIVIVLISMSKILKKAERSPILGLIPIYNYVPLLEITNMPKHYVILFIIPIINIPFLLMFNIQLAKLFKKNQTFGIGLLVAPFIFYPILAFSTSEYIGINLVAMNDNNNISNIPIIDNDKNMPIEKEVNDQIDVETKSSNISLGGGKYQKDYKDSLVTIDEDMIAKGEIQKSKTKEGLVTDGKFFNNTLLQEKEENNNSQNQVSNNINQNSNVIKTNISTSNNVFDVSYIQNTPQQNIQQPVQQPTQQSINQVPIQPQAPQNVATPFNQPVDLLKSNGAAAQQGPKLCPNCGTRVADNAKICMICGQKLL